MLGSSYTLDLDEEEQALLGTAPEECFRHVVRRGALSLDEVTAQLSPRIAAVVRSIAAGERPTALPDPPQLPEQFLEWAWGREAVQSAQETLVAHPQLVQMLDEGILMANEALQVAQALDRALGRYMTGTLYAAP